MKKYFSIAGVSAFIFGLYAYAAGAAVPTATATLDTIMETVINTSVDLVTKIFTTYWPYALVIGVITGLVGLFVRFTRIGIHK
jgi:hypothetical protein